MTEESEINIFRCLDFLRDQAPAYAQAKAHRIYMEEFRKTQKAILMKDAEIAGHKAGNIQEREAYASSAYHDVLVGLYEAVKAEEALKWKMVAAQAKISVWQSLGANERAEKKAI